ncbi:MAG: RpiB/LacA/LacB family sugar-phosphate isomerase [Planctomycetaceae bacterium]|nr:RpiB/LacA/LacB family sugar-phosphate isomerase [Planctomycetaceae bacterium]
MQATKILLASDHRGIGVRALIIDYLLPLPQYDVWMFNDEFPEYPDYPDIAAYAAKALSEGHSHRAILICGTGIGMTVAANKFPGIRAAACQNAVVAELSRKHNDSNILCLSGDLLGETSSVGIVAAWLATPFEGGKHRSRLEKIRLIENQNYVHRL